MDVVITYETLFDLLRKEKSQADLQELPKDFYGQAVAYLRQKERDVQQAGGFSSPTAQKVLLQFKNVQKILRELYERRERKIIEMALNRARSERNIIDTSLLLPEEQPFFEACASLLKETKGRILEPLLRGEAPAGTRVPEAESSKLTAEPVVANKEGAHEDGAKGGQASMRNADEATTHPIPDEATTHPVPEQKRATASPDIAARESCTVRFLVPVPKFLGLQGEVHGPFKPGDTATLPGKIAAVLLKKKRVELSTS